MSPRHPITAPHPDLRPPGRIRDSVPVDLATHRDMCETPSHVPAGVGGDMAAHGALPIGRETVDHAAANANLASTRAFMHVVAGEAVHDRDHVLSTVPGRGRCWFGLSWFDAIRVQFSTEASLVDGLVTLAAVPASDAHDGSDVGVDGSLVGCSCRSTSPRSIAASVSSNQASSASYPISL